MLDDKFCYIFFYILITLLIYCQYYVLKAYFHKNFHNLEELTTK